MAQSNSKSMGTSNEALMDMIAYISEEDIAEMRHRLDGKRTERVNKVKADTLYERMLSRAIDVFKTDLIKIMGDSNFYTYNGQSLLKDVISVHSNILSVEIVNNGEKHTTHHQVLFIIDSRDVEYQIDRLRTNVYSVALAHLCNELVRHEIL